MYGFPVGPLLFQLFNILLFIGWIFFTVLALFALRKRQLTDTARALWAIFVVVVPILGALAFAIVILSSDWPKESS